MDCIQRECGDKAAQYTVKNGEWSSTSLGINCTFMGRCPYIMHLIYLYLIKKTLMEEVSVQNQDVTGNASMQHTFNVVDIMYETAMYTGFIP